MIKLKEIIVGDRDGESKKTAASFFLSPMFTLQTCLCSLNVPLQQTAGMEKEKRHLNEKHSVDKHML